MVERTALKVEEILKQGMVAGLCFIASRRMTACFTSTTRYSSVFPSPIFLFYLPRIAFFFLFFCAVCLFSSGRLAMRFHLYNAAFRQNNQLFLLLYAYYYFFHSTTRHSLPTFLFYFINIFLSQASKTIHCNIYIYIYTE